MHFIKTVVSLFAFSSFAAARLDGSDSDLVRREMAEAAHEEYLAARDEYFEKRDLFRRIGSGGTCQPNSKGGMECKFFDQKTRRNRFCGPCRANAPRNEYCLCNSGNVR
uniref:Invertebrate defensins family profile domain-containing protein n=1 Tax=Bionectria ochroleuca TaxID=29856 RepID=A0A0B7KRF9_BIOOC